MQETRLGRTETRSCQEFRERSGCVESLSTVSGQFECQQDCSRVSHSLKEVFLSRIVVSWRSEPLGKTIFATKCFRTALSCATVVPHFIWCHNLYYIPTSVTSQFFCNREERKRNRLFTRPIFPMWRKWSGNETTIKLAEVKLHSSSVHVCDVVIAHVISGDAQTNQQTEPAGKIS